MHDHPETLTGHEPAPAEQMLTARQVAKLLNVTPSWVYQHASGRRHPRLPSYKVGGAVRFRMSEVIAFIERLKRTQQDWGPVQ